MTAILVKEKLNLGQEFLVLETFLRHNYSELMISYSQWSQTKKKELDNISFDTINTYFKKYFTKCFEKASD